MPTIDISGGSIPASASERRFWDSNFRFSAILPDFSDCLLRQVKLSHDFRTKRENVWHQAYGTHPRQLVRTYPGAGAARAACLFVHGGYWRALSIDEHDYIGQWLTPETDFHNIGYRLQPEIGFAQQVMDVAQAIQACLEQCANRAVSQVHLVGHSAGAHLVFCAVQLLKDAPTQINSLCGISGIYDLTPLARSFLSEEIVLSTDDVAHYSPLLQTLPFLVMSYCIAVGELETPEFLRQALNMAAYLQNGGHKVQHLVLRNAHHMQTPDALFASINA